MLENQQKYIQLRGVKRTLERQIENAELCLKPDIPGNLLRALAVGGLLLGASALLSSFFMAVGPLVICSSITILTSSISIFSKLPSRRDPYSIPYDTHRGDIQSLIMSGYGVRITGVSVRGKLIDFKVATIEELKEAKKIIDFDLEEISQRVVSGKNETPPVEVHPSLFTPRQDRATMPAISSLDYGLS